MIVEEARSLGRKVIRAMKGDDRDPRDAPMPPGDPVLGHARLMRNDPLHHFTRWAVEHNGAVSLRIPGARFMLVTAPEGVKQVLQTHAKKYSKPTYLIKKQPFRSYSFVPKLIKTVWTKRRYEFRQ